MERLSKQSEIARLAAVLTSHGYNILGLNYEEISRPDQFPPELTGCIQIKVLPRGKPVSRFIA